MSPNNMALQITHKEQIFQGKFLKAWSSTFLDKAGKEQYWEWVQKKDIVVIFPITHDGKIVLIKNYRVPLEQYVLDNPAGLVETSDMRYEATARRELLEETGYEAEKFIALPKSPQAPGMSNQFFHPFIAVGSKKVSNQRGDETEDIEVLEIQASQLIDLYKQSADIVCNVRVLGLYSVAQSMGLVK